MEVTIPAALSHTGTERRDVRDIDSCIAPLVKALNDGGVLTVASCCGHGKGFGNIALRDGRELLIAPSWEAARAMEIRLSEPARLPSSGV